MCRDALSYGFYFLSFEFFRRKCKKNGYKNEIMIDFYCGGSAGKNISYYNLDNASFI